MNQTEKRIEFFYRYCLFFLEAYHRGINLCPYSYHRTAQEQEKLYKAGKSRRDGYNDRSKHQDWEAIDAVHYEKFAFVRNIENHGQKQIYDKIYNTRKELEKEMHDAGYEILEFKGLVHHFYLQAVISRISSKMRLFKLGTKLIHFIERIPLGRPLEWIVICRTV